MNYSGRLFTWNPENYQLRNANQPSPRWTCQTSLNPDIAGIHSLDRTAAFLSDTHVAFRSCWISPIRRQASVAFPAAPLTLPSVHLLWPSLLARCLIIRYIYFFTAFDSYIVSSFIILSQLAVAGQVTAHELNWPRLHDIWRMFFTNTHERHTDLDFLSLPQKHTSWGKKKGGTVVRKRQQNNPF